MKKHCEYCGKPIGEYLRSTKKYCNDTCRRYAFYSRQGIAPEKDDEELTPRKLPLNGKPETALNANDPLPLNAKGENATADLFPKEKEKLALDAKDILPFNAKDELPANAKNDLPLNVREESETLTQNTLQKESPPKYRFVESSLINAIDRYRMESSAEEMFGAPGYYWSESTIEYMRWVTVRFRCLVENILRLSNLRVIDRNTVRELSTAFDQLVSSDNFYAMPNNYPFSQLILELCERFQHLLGYSDSDEITLQLSTERRAQLIATKFLIGNFVPKVSFSQLDFSDMPEPKVEQNDLEEDEDEEDDEEAEDCQTNSTHF